MVLVTVIQLVGRRTDRERVSQEMKTRDLYMYSSVLYQVDTVQPCVPVFTADTQPPKSLGMTGF